MAKKKRKIFKKSQLLSLFHNENYQKVISKIKQFEIDGMSDKELHKIQLTSYSELAKENFEVGDINRAMRDIESLLLIENNDEYRVIKLKYLCYMEHFKDAMIFAQDLIISKNLKIKKEAIFLYLLASIYSGNYEIDEKNLKLLPAARANYILGFRSFLQNDIGNALIFFEKCNPRAKVEKENLNVIKSIIVNQTSSSNQIIKPLYHFLISGDDTNLQNTKNSRVIIKEVKAQFAKNSSNNEIENLISLKSSTTAEIITKEIEDKEVQTKLIYNNIVLLVEKQRNYGKALEMFIKHKRSLIELVESGILFIQIKSLEDDSKSDKLVVNFFSSYLKLHHKKLSEFQLDFIFRFLMHSSSSDSSIKLIKNYGGDSILFLFKDMPNITDEIKPSHQEKFNKIIKKYSIIRDKSFDGILELIETFDEYISKITTKDKEKFTKQLIIILTLFQNCQKPHKKYQPTIFNIFTSMARCIQNFDFAKNRDLYIQLSETINKFIEIYNIDRVDLSSDIKTLFTSIEKKKSIKKEEKSDDDDMFDMFRDMMDSYDEYEEDEDFDENDLEDIKQDFIEALRDNKNPFSNKLKLLEENFYNDTLFEFFLEMVAKAVEFNRLDNNFMFTLFEMLGINPEESYYREDLIIAIKKYAIKDIKTTLTFFNTCITMVSKKNRETVWYLKWLETYLYLVDDYKQPKDKTFESVLGHLLRVQQKKKFKSFNARFEKIINRFKDKGLF